MFVPYSSFDLHVRLCFDEQLRLPACNRSVMRMQLERFSARVELLPNAFCSVDISLELSSRDPQI